jgi:CheY-like chemotaxis protein
MQEVFEMRTESAMIPDTEKAKTILLVEDEPTVRNLLCEVLERSGYEVLACSHPEEGIETCRLHGSQIDLLLTDVVMPGMNGKEMATRIIGMLPELRVVFMSGYTEHVLLKDGQLDARIEYLQKPFSLQTLRQRVARVISETSQRVQ